MTGGSLLDDWKLEQGVSGWRNSRSGLAFDGVHFYWFHLDSEFFQPSNGSFDFFSFAFKGEGDDANFIGHAGLADVGDYGKFLP